MSLSYLTDTVCLLPDPQGLTQQVPEKGVARTVHPLKDIAFQHLQRVALVAEKDPEQKKYRRRVVKVGSDDPYTAYANMLCDVAWAREHRRPKVVMSNAAPAPRRRRRPSRG